MEKWNIYYDDNIPHELIKSYEDYLSTGWWSKGQNVIWTYNPDTLKFDCKKNNKTKKKLK